MMEAKLIEYKGLEIEVHQKAGGGFLKHDIRILIENDDLYDMLDTQKTGRQILEEMFRLAEASDKDGNGED